MSERKRHARWLWVDGIAPALGVLLVIVLVLGFDAYTAGTRNDMGRLFGAVMFLLFVGLPVMGLALAGQLT